MYEVICGTIGRTRPLSLSSRCPLREDVEEINLAKTCLYTSVCRCLKVAIAAISHLGGRVCHQEVDGPRSAQLGQREEPTHEYWLRRPLLRIDSYADAAGSFSSISNRTVDVARFSISLYSMSLHRLNCSSGRRPPLRRYCYWGQNLARHCSAERFRDLFSAMQSY